MKLTLPLISNLLFALVSIVFCIIAPNRLDVSFCQIVAATYILHNIMYFWLLERENWLGFEIFFCIAFFFINFLYPTFIYPIAPNYTYFDMAFNSDLVSKATTIAYLGYAFYLLGCTSFKSEKQEEPTPPTFEITGNQVAILFIMAVVSFGGYVVTGGLAAMKDVYANYESANEVGVYSYFMSLFVFSSYLLAIFAFQLHSWVKWLYVASLVVFMGLMLSTGSRTLAMGVGLILIVSFNNNIRRFRLYELLILMAAGVILLYFVVINRSSDVSQDVASNVDSDDLGWIGIFFDLIINNRNLYVLVDYAEAHSYTYFQGILIDLLAPIPGSAGILIKLTGQPMELLHGGMLPTFLQLGADSTWGLGTNMIGEVYRSFGYPGTALIMFGIGHLIKTSYYRGRTNKYWYLLYFLFISHAIMYGRSPFIMDLRRITWAMAMLYVICLPVKFVFKKKHI